MIRGIVPGPYRPGDHLLSAFLMDRIQRDHGPIRPEAELLLTFTQRGIQRIFPRPDQAFGNAPGPCISFRPEWASHVPEQHFDLPILDPVRNNTGTDTHLAINTFPRAIRTPLPSSIDSVNQPGAREETSIDGVRGRDRTNAPIAE